MPAPETPDLASTTALDDLPRERGEGEQRCGCVAAWIGDQRPLGRRELGQAVAPRARRDAVPLARQVGVGQAVRAGEVDDDGALRRGECRGVVVPETEKEDVRAGGGGLRVRHERGQRAVKTRVERPGGLAGKRVRAERNRLEVGVGEHAVERLLARIAGAADDRSGEH